MNAMRLVSAMPTLDVSGLTMSQVRRSNRSRNWNRFEYCSPAQTGVSIRLARIAHAPFVLRHQNVFPPAEVLGPVQRAPDDVP